MGNVQEGSFHESVIGNKAKEEAEDMRSKEHLPYEKAINVQAEDKEASTNAYYVCK
jgi:hypothetical protein